MVTIDVAGSAQHQHPAERGMLRLEARLETAGREEAVARVAELHARLSAEARGHEESGAATRWSAEQVRAWSYVRFDEPERVRTVHVAAASVSVRFRDFEALSVWATSLAMEPGIAVEGVEWLLTRQTAASVATAVRLDAVRDAQERASAYAAALGLERVTAVRLSEPESGSGGFAKGADMMMRSAAFASGPQEIELVPERIVVSATILARFEAS